jgi:hypothetical protein
MKSHSAAPHSSRRRTSDSGKFSSGKFQQCRRLGLTIENGGEHLGWQLEISRSRVGITIRRDVYSVTMRDEDGSFVHRLSGFANREQAVAAARKWIEEVQALLEIRIDREHRLSGMRALKRSA